MAARGSGATHVAVLGGGLQGCCTALALAERGARVTLFERNDSLLTEAAFAAEGKLHLGYVYAADPSLATARLVMRGSLAFGPVLRRLLGSDDLQATVSSPFDYLVHRDSQLTPEDVHAYMRSVHAEVREAAASNGGDYFGQELAEPLRVRPEPELGEVHGSPVVAAVTTPEIAVDMVPLCAALRRRIAGEPLIELRLGATVDGVGVDDGRLHVATTSARSRETTPCDHVVNALWGGRLAVDATLGLEAPRQWIHRFKYGIRFRVPGLRLPSVTIVLGPFGDVVSYGEGRFYVSWYPACLRARSTELAPPSCPLQPEEPDRSEIIGASLSALGELLPALQGVDPAGLDELAVRGGPIVAWGATDIRDPRSGLHRRSQVGITTHGGYHTIDPGKLALAPYFAEACARRVTGG